MSLLFVPDDIVFVVKYAIKMLKTIPETTKEIKLCGCTLYAYYCMHIEREDERIPYTDYTAYKEFHKTVQSSYDISDDVLPPETKKSKQVAVAYSEYFQKLVHWNQMPPCSPYLCVDLVNFKDLERFSLYSVWCKEIMHIPQTLQYLDCGGCGIVKITKLPRTLEFLNCNYNKLKFLPPLYFTKLKALFCDFNELIYIPMLPKSVEFVSCSYNVLNELPCPLPESLETLSCANNQLTILPPIPPKLIGLYVDKNFLKTIPELPKSVIDLFFANNEVSKMPELPVFLKRISCYKNPIKQYTPFPPSVHYANIDGTVMKLHC